MLQNKPQDLQHSVFITQFTPITKNKRKLDEFHFGIISRKITHDDQITTVTQPEMSSDLNNLTRFMVTPQQLRKLFQ